MLLNHFLAVGISFIDVPLYTNICNIASNIDCLNVIIIRDTNMAGIAYTPFTIYMVTATIFQRCASYIFKFYHAVRIKK